MRRASLFLCLVAACGTLDPPDAVHLVDAPKGPFHETASFEVCVGHARLVPEDAGGKLVGLCVPAAKTPRSCEMSTECGAEEECVCGECKIQGCVASSPCSGGRICSGNRCATACNTKSECAAGEECDNGACALPCKTTDDCPFGAICDSFDLVCRAQTCAVDDDCGGGKTCVLEERAGTAREPAWAVLPTGTFVYLEIATGADRAIYRAPPPSDGRLHVTETPVTGGAGFGAPAPFSHGGALVLFAEDPMTGIVLLRATDDTGTSFAAPESVLGPSLSWEGGHVGSPSVVNFSGENWLFYEGGMPEAIGAARLDASLHGSDRLPQPVVTSQSAASPTWMSTTRVRAPDALVIDDEVLLYFTANGVEHGDAMQGATVLPASANDSIGLAVTADFARFDVAPWGPVLARRTNLRTYLGERESTARVVPGGVEMLFVASDADGSNAGLSLATSPLAHWKRHSAPEWPARRSRTTLHDSMSTLDEDLKKAANHTGDRETPTNAAVAVAPKAPQGNLKLLIGLLVAGGVMVALVFNFRDAAVYAKSVHQVIAEGAKPGRMVRVEGDLVNGTLKQITEPSCLYTFTITDGTERLDVRYANCVVPDTFRDVPGMKVTVEGDMTTPEALRATLIMAKCPSKYEMKERSSKGETMPHAENMPSPQR